MVLTSQPKFLGLDDVYPRRGLGVDAISSFWASIKSLNIFILFEKMTEMPFC